MIRWQDEPQARPQPPPAPRDLDGSASRLWWRRVQAERDTALDWQRRAMLAEARVRELEALLDQQAALAGVRVRQAERRTDTATRQRDWLTAALALALALGGLALALWIGGARFVGGGWA